LPVVPRSIGVLLLIGWAPLKGSFVGMSIQDHYSRFPATSFSSPSFLQQAEGTTTWCLTVWSMFTIKPTWTVWSLQEKARKKEIWYKD